MDRVKVDGQPANLQAAVPYAKRGFHEIYTIIPAATVSLVASSIRMKLPVLRLRR